MMAVLHLGAKLLTLHAWPCSEQIPFEVTMWNIIQGPGDYSNHTDVLHMYLTPGYCASGGFSAV